MEFSSHDPWAALALGTDGLSAKYCELNRFGGYLRQPINSLSNAAFALAGVAVLADHRVGRLSVSLRRLFAASLFALAAGSGFFHASITLVAQRMDMGATYAVVLALIGFSFAIERPVEEHARWLAGIVVVDLVFVGLDLYRFGAWLLPLLLLLCLGAALRVLSRVRHSARHLVLAGVGILTGATAWGLDERKVLCAPESVLQWHALWHCATAFGALHLFWFFDRSSARGGSAAAISTPEATP
ncbi:MAG: ceramidase domain-containing protein [Myxococcales bacterium]|nr:ceramidase domain-containing protein [Myxococcales bacterium]